MPASVIPALSEDTLTALPRGIPVLEAVDSQVALERVALSIRDQLNAATAEMSSAARSGALKRCGAVLGTTSAVLAAVRPHALQGALAFSATIAAGATGLWPTIQAFADIKPKSTHGKWHYVWVGDRHISWEVRVDE